MHCSVDTGSFCNGSDSANCNVWPGADCRVKNLEARWKYKEQSCIFVPSTSPRTQRREWKMRRSQTVISIKSL